MRGTGNANFLLKEASVKMYCAQRWRLQEGRLQRLSKIEKRQLILRVWEPVKLKTEMRLQQKKINLQ